MTELLAGFMSLFSFVRGFIESNLTQEKDALL